ncbi:hypothetical protein [Fodinicola feengrottensis]|uniref:hypothetical protein n=1 Tax=Fodinicola feengrottensis TaxID=435914 RepID=UPI0024434770|nr:hypothetical protein [Fodinicola feengrottensis]
MSRTRWNPDASDWSPATNAAPESRLPGWSDSFRRPCLMRTTDAYDDAGDIVESARKLRW